MQKIIRNAIRCKHCGDIIESTSRHHFAVCSCGCCSVDGSHDCLRRGFIDSKEEDYQKLSEIVN